MRRPRAGRADFRFRGRNAAEDSGQALVELALALPLLLLILIGIFEFARAYSIKQSIVNAAREGARAAVVQGALVTPSDSLVTLAVSNYLTSNGISPDSVTVAAIAPDGTSRGAFSSAQTGDAISVTVYDRYEFILVGPVVGLFGKNFRTGVDLGSRATMRME